MNTGSSEPFAVALESMASTPRAIAVVVHAAPGSILESRPTADEWSPHEVLSHLLFVEGMLRARIAAMAAAPDGTPIPAAGEAAIDTRPASELVEAWRRRRAANLRWIRSLGPSELERVGEHRRWGPISVREHIVEWSYHDFDHFRQLLASLEADLYPSIGGWRGLYPPPFATPDDPAA